MERKTYKIEEVAEILGIGKASLYAAVRKGELPAIRLGKRIVVSRATIDALLDVDVERVKDHDSTPILQMGADD